MSDNRFQFGRISQMRTCLFGLAIFGIMVFHSPLETAVYETRFFRVFLNIGVEIFLVLSAVGLYASLENEPRLGAFYWKRALRTLLPMLPVVLVWFGYYDLLGGAGWQAFFLDVTLLRFWVRGSRSEWFVALILVLYAVYPALHSLRKSRRGAVWILILTAAFVALNIVWAKLEPVSYERTEIAFSRVPVFLLGCLIAPYVREKKKAPRGMLGVCGALFAALFVIKFFGHFAKPWSRLINAPLGFLLTILLSQAFYACRDKTAGRPFVRFFTFLGGFSLELYLLHERVLHVVQAMGFPNGPYGIFVSAAAIALAILVAWMYAKVCGRVRAKLL